MPIPWEAASPAYGFSPTGESWLPQPSDWARFARDSQEGGDHSTLELYRLALGLRAEHGLGLGSLEWLTGYADDVVAYRNGTVTVIANLGSDPLPLPAGTVVCASGTLLGGELPSDTTAWIVA